METMFRGHMMWNGFKWFAVELEDGLYLSRTCRGCWIDSTGMWNSSPHSVEITITRDEISARTARVARLRSYGEDEIAAELEAKAARFL